MLTLITVGDCKQDIDINYSLKGFYQWSLLLYNKTLISTVPWPSETLNITQDTIIKLVGNDSYLSNLKHLFEENR